MYTLRKISKKGKYQMNICLGKGYTLTTRESEREFKEYEELMGISDDNVFAFISGDSTGVLSLVKSQKNYIMTESGATFDNLNNYAHCLNQDVKTTTVKKILGSELVVTFTCNDHVHVYDEKSGILPMSPYKTHSSIEAAVKYLKETRNVNYPEIIVK
jgi:queuine/archaeosine tRNA-ribosyltransferase